MRIISVDPQPSVMFSGCTPQQSHRRAMIFGLLAWTVVGFRERFRESCFGSFSLAKGAFIAIEPDQERGRIRR